MVECRLAWTASVSRQWLIIGKYLIVMMYDFTGNTHNPSYSAVRTPPKESKALK
jgi:hypothetical protein